MHIQTIKLINYKTDECTKSTDTIKFTYEINSERYTERKHAKLL